MVLLDTHTLLWLLGDNDNLSEKAVEALDHHERFISIASLWEIAIKKSLVDPKRKLYMNVSIQDIAEECDRQGIGILRISPSDCDRITQLPHLHEDPFDRLIMAQAIERNLLLITKDEKIQRYDSVKTVW